MHGAIRREGEDSRVEGLSLGLNSDGATGPMGLVLTRPLLKEYANWTTFSRNRTILPLCFCFSRPALRWSGESKTLLKFVLILFLDQYSSAGLWFSCKWTALTQSSLLLSHWWTFPSDWCTSNLPWKAMQHSQENMLHYPCHDKTGTDVVYVISTRKHDL